MRRIYTDAALETVRRMIDEGARNKQIAAAIGTTELRLVSRLSQLGIARNPSPRTSKVVFIRMPVDLIAKYDAVASDRMIKTHRLLQAILGKVAQDNLFAAVLDDE